MGNCISVTSNHFVTKEVAIAEGVGRGQWGSPGIFFTHCEVAQPCHSIDDKKKKMAKIERELFKEVCKDKSISSKQRQDIKKSFSYF